MGTRLMSGEGEPASGASMAVPPAPIPACVGQLELPRPGVRSGSAPVPGGAGAVIGGFSLVGLRRDAEQATSPDEVATPSLDDTPAAVQPDEAPQPEPVITAAPAQSGTHLAGGDALKRSSSLVADLAPTANPRCSAVVVQPLSC